MGWTWTVVFAALSLPLMPFWPDFEQARRGIAMLIAGAALVPVALRAVHTGLSPWATRTWLALVAIHALSTTWAANGGEALARTAWLATLFATAWAAARTCDARTLLRAFLPTGLAVAGFGLLQALGVEWPVGYSDASDPVSTLGNRNAASELGALALLAAALAWVRRDASVIAGAVLAFGAAYLWVNQSRSGLVAVALTLLPLALAPFKHHAGRRRASMVGLTLLGLLLGEGVRRSAPDVTPAPPTTAPNTPAPTTAAPAPSRNLATLEVRMELWTSGAAMWRDAALLGHGAGQFKAEYPRYRSQREIELSTIGRTQAAAPRTAHNDPIEIAVESGTLGLLAFVAFWFVVLAPYHRGGWARTLPLVAFLLLCLVRAPLANAPAAVFALAYAGALASAPARAGARRLLRALAAAALALALGWLGLALLQGENWATVHVDAQRRPTTTRQTLDQMHALDRAVAWLPWDSQLRALRTRLRFALALGRQDRPALTEMLAAEGDVATLLALAPHSTTNLLTAAEVANAAGDQDRAMGWLHRILELDPPHPEARLFLATILVGKGDTEGALDVLYAAGHPHPRLLADLPQHLIDLAATTTDAARARLDGEAEFFAAFLALRSHPDAPETAQLLARLANGQTTRNQRDLRPAILLSARLFALGDTQAVAAAGARLPRDKPLADRERALLAEFLAPLITIPAWADALRHRP